MNAYSPMDIEYLYNKYMNEILSGLFIPSMRVKLHKSQNSLFPITHYYYKPHEIKTEFDKKYIGKKLISFWIDWQGDNMFFKYEMYHIDTQEIIKYGQKP